MSADVFDPGKAWSRDIDLDPIMRCDRPEHPPELFEFNYWFTDARGQHWHRVDRNPPDRISELPSVEWARFHHRPRRELFGNG